MTMRLLVVGAAQGSLGSAVAAEAERQCIRVVTAGVQRDGFHEHYLDVTRPMGDVVNTLRTIGPFTHVVCTAGVNKQAHLSEAEGVVTARMYSHMLVNAIGPICLLESWMNLLKKSDLPSHWQGQFVAISSNSAQVARSSSAPYCASKAALSMAIRCAARELAVSQQRWRRLLVYGYEPGWIEDTPMSNRILKGLPDETPPHRIPGGGIGVSKEHLASLVVRNLLMPSQMLNGCMMRLDGGEQ